MHELSIAISLVEAACEKAAELGGVRVEALRVEVGKLSGVVPEALLFSFDIAAGGTPIEGATLRITHVSPVIRCARCDAEREVPDVRLLCPLCEEPASDVVHGRELLLVALEVS
jgi:hydrogenase nickel incorporation protein HypA/HybF